MALDAATLKQIVDSSAQLSTWGLGVLGGSVVAILNSSYRRPDQLNFRLPYLLFIPGWLGTALSLYLGNILLGKYLAWLIVNESSRAIIAEQINNVYGVQRISLLVSLGFFGLWLFVYLLTWIFSNDLQTGSKK